MSPSFPTRRSSALPGVPDGIAALEGYPHHWSRINRELEYVYGVMGEVLADAGSSLGHTLKINSFHTAAEDVYEALRLRPGVFGDEQIGRASRRERVGYYV